MSRSFAFVSTCSEDGWGEYGARFVERFIEHFPAAMKLYMYVDFKTNVVSPRVEYVALKRCKGLQQFQALAQREPFARGDFIVHDLHDQASNPGVVWNARKFSFKVFSVEHAVTSCKEDVIVWIDADTFAFQDIPASFISEIAPPHSMLGYLGRYGKYSECGYVSYNRQHWATQEFVETLADLYRSGTIFSLKEWHDSYVFDVARAAFEQRYGIENYNISAEQMMNDHVFINSELGRYLDHLKGPRKSEGRSRAGDLSVSHNAEYWSNSSALAPDSGANQIGAPPLGTPYQSGAKQLIVSVGASAPSTTQ